MMNQAQLSASYALWRAREIRYYRAWRKLVKTKPRSDAGRANAHALYKAALVNRQRREEQLRSLPITRLSSHGTRMLIGEEGNLPYVYNDSRGHATVGIGHLLHLGRYTAADAAKWGTKNHQIHTPGEFVTFFYKDIQAYENAVRKVWTHARSKVSRERFDADVSLCFNIGIGGFQTSTHARFIRDGRSPLETARAMLRWNKPPEIMGRRHKEYELWLNGHYS